MSPSRPDIGPRPIAAVPAYSSISQNSSVQVSIELDKTSSNPTTVYLTSSNPSVLSVQSSVVIPAGHTVTSVTCYSSSPYPIPMSSTPVHITASTVDGYIATDISVY